MKFIIHRYAINTKASRKHFLTASHLRVSENSAGDSGAAGDGKARDRYCWVGIGFFFLLLSLYKNIFLKNSEPLFFLHFNINLDQWG